MPVRIDPCSPRTCETTPVGNRTKPISASETPTSQERGTESGTLDAPKTPSDPDLDLIVTRWPGLPEHVRAAILTLVQGQKP